MSDFLVKFAQNQREVDAVQRLRFEVFNVEMEKGLSSSYESGLDRDEYDSICDHILIIDKKSRQTIGTYRLLRRSHLDGRRRFYSEGEFDLRNIKKLKGEILELGRSCVHKDYRRDSIIHLLWSQILDYVNLHRVCYIMGCPSLYNMNPDEVSRIYALMKRRYFVPKGLRVYPREEMEFGQLDDGVKIDGEEKKIFLTLPSLVRSYLKVGALVCGRPAVDRGFGTVDFFMLLEVAKISKEYLKHFHIGGVDSRGS